MLDIQNPIEARKVIRENKYTEQTAGTANKFVQGNLCILPSKYAMDFASFCQKNPKPCPLIGFGIKGDPSLKDLGDIDIRTDVPQYRIWEKGKLIDEPYDIKKYWNEDLTTFVLGCSMSFELPLIEAGIPIQHIENDTIVPMYRTSIDCESQSIEVRYIGTIVSFSICWIGIPASINGNSKDIEHPKTNVVKSSFQYFLMS